MKEAVSSVLDLRNQAPTGLNRLIWWSGAVHITVATSILVWQAWTNHPHDDKIMMISLSGAVGPSTGGATPIGGKQVDQVAPEPKRVEPTPVQSAPRPNEITVPTKPAAKPPPTQRSTVAPTSSVVKPATGAQVAAGSSVLETGAKGESTGLAQGGGGTGAVVNAEFQFCCKAYLDAMVDAIRKNVRFDIGEHGLAVIQFEVGRDGTIDRASIKIDKSSNSQRLDNEATFGVRATKLPPLPDEYKQKTLTVSLKVQF